ALEIEQGQAGIGFVPDLGGQLVAALEVLEVVLTARAPEQQPVGPWPADTTAESHIQSPRNLVDEVIHVGLMTPVIIAREQHAALVIDEHPAGEVNRADTGKVAACEEMPCGELNHGKDNCDQHTAEQTRFGGAEGGVLVGEVMILEALQLLQQLGAGSR